MKFFYYVVSFVASVLVIGGFMHHCLGFKQKIVVPKPKIECVKCCGDECKKCCGDKCGECCK